MPPRRPTAPHSGGAAARAGGRPVPRTPVARAGADRPPPAGRPPASGRAATSSGRAAPAGRGPTRTATAGGTPATGLTVTGGRTRPPVIRPVTILSGVLVVVVLLLAPYLRPWVDQRSQIDDGRDQVETLQHQVDALSAELRRWDDPAYVRAQARQRLNFVMPGESGYVLLNDTAQPAVRPDPRSVTAALPSDGDSRVWYTKVWDSIRIAGDPTTEQARTSGTR